MRTPRFIAEMGEPRHRAQLHLSAKTGFITCLAVLALAIAADALGVVTFRRVFLVPIFVKLATNTAAWAALKLRRGELLDRHGQRGDRRLRDDLGRLLHGR